MVAVKYTLEDFVHDMDNLLVSQPTREKIFDRGSDCLSRLISNPDAIPGRFRQPVGSGGRANHGSWLLHHSPDSGLLVTAVVWGPGDHAAPHDHRTWGMIGVMDNALTETRFRRVDDHERTDWAQLERDRSSVVKPGEISLLIPEVDEIPPDGQLHRPPNRRGPRLWPGSPRPGARALRLGNRRHTSDDDREIRQLLIRQRHAGLISTPRVYTWAITHRCRYISKPATCSGLNSPTSPRLLSK